MGNTKARMFFAGALLMGVALIINRGIRHGSDIWQGYLGMFVIGFSVAALLFWFPKNDFPPAVFFRLLFSDDQEPEHYEAIPNIGETINGDTVIRLKRCIDAFPVKYPEYRTRRPKLDTDIRPWIKEEVAASEREAHVFGSIIVEHFELSPDTQKGE